MTFGSNLSTTAGVVVSNAYSPLLIGATEEGSGCCMGTLHSGGLQQPAERRQATPASGADAADRDLELVRYLRIRNGRVSHEHLEQPLPSLGQTGHGIADDLVALVSENVLIDFGLGSDNAGEDLVIVSQNHPLARCQTAQALIPRGCREPGTHTIRVLQAADMLEQAQPGRLDDIGRVALHQPEFPRNRPDEPVILLDKTLPRPPVA